MVLFVCVFLLPFIERKREKKKRSSIIISHKKRTRAHTQNECYMCGSLVCVTASFCAAKADKSHAGHVSLAFPNLRSSFNV